MVHDDLIRAQPGLEILVGHPARVREAPGGPHVQLALFVGQAVCGGQRRRAEREQAREEA